MPAQGLKEADEDEELEDPQEDENLEDTPADDEVEVTPPVDSPDNIPTEDEENPEEFSPDNIPTEDEETPGGEYINPLDNSYAVKYGIGQEVVLNYANGTKSKLYGTIDGYDTEGFYRVLWSNGKTTNGFTDIALSDLVDTIEDNKCVCGETNFVTEGNKLVCDNCGRSMNEREDHLSKLDKSRPKDKKLVRSEATPVSTTLKPPVVESGCNRTLKDSIKSAFKNRKINEDTEESLDLFSRLKEELYGKFWTRESEMIEDVESLGYEVVYKDSQYLVVSPLGEEGDDLELQIPIVGTSRTMTLEFEKSTIV